MFDILITPETNAPKKLDTNYTTFLISPVVIEVNASEKLDTDYTTFSSSPEVIEVREHDPAEMNASEKLDTNYTTFANCPDVIEIRDKVREDIENLQQVMRNLQNCHEAEKQELKKTTSNLEAAKAELLETHLSMEDLANIEVILIERVRILRDVVNKHSETFDQHEADIAALEKQQEGIVERIAKFQNILSEKQDQKEELDSYLTQNTQKVHDIEDHAHELAKVEKDLADKIRGDFFVVVKMEKERDELKEEIESLQELAAKLRDEVSTNSGSATSTTDEWSDNEDKIVKLNADIVAGSEIMTNTECGLGFLSPPNDFVVVGTADDDLDDENHIGLEEEERESLMEVFFLNNFKVVETARNDPKLDDEEGESFMEVSF